MLCNQSLEKCSLHAEWEQREQRRWLAKGTIWGMRSWYPISLSCHNYSLNSRYFCSLILLLLQKYDPYEYLHWTRTKRPRGFMGSPRVGCKLHFSTDDLAYVAPNIIYYITSYSLEAQKCWTLRNVGCGSAWLLIARATHSKLPI